MKWRLVITPKVQESLRTLPPLTKRHTRQALDELCRDPRIGKALRDELAGFYTLPVGRFRIIYRIEEHTITVVAVGPRPTVYDDLILAQRYTLQGPSHGYLADRPRRKASRRRS